MTVKPGRPSAGVPAVASPDRAANGGTLLGSQLGKLGGRPKKKRHVRTIIRELHEAGAFKGTAQLDALVAKSLGIDIGDIPIGLDPEELLWFQTVLYAAAGDSDAKAEVTDRLTPKPKRVEVEDVTPHRQALSGGTAEEDQAAQEYMDLLDP